MFQIVIVGDESAIMIFPNIQIISEWRPSTSWCIPKLQIYTEIPLWSLPRQNPSSGLAWRSLTTHPMPRMDARGWKQCLMFIYVYQMFEVPTVLFRLKSQQLFIISPKACQHVVLCPWRLSFKPTIHQALRGVPEVWVPPTARCCGSEVPMEGQGWQQGHWGSQRWHCGWFCENHFDAIDRVFLQRIRTEWGGSSASNIAQYVEILF